MTCLKPSVAKRNILVRVHGLEVDDVFITFLKVTFFESLKVKSDTSMGCFREA